MGRLLLLGMIAGLIAGLLAFGVARVWGEPPVAAAIAIEEAQAAAEHVDDVAVGTEQPAAHTHGGEDELVSRPTQAGIGLFTGMIVFATALGGVFALVYAWAHGRLSDLSPLATAGAIAVLGYVSVTLVPGLKYAANPPAVGSPETIGMRTGLYFLMLAISIAGMVAAVVVARRVTDHRLGWLAGGATYAGIVVLAALILPVVREVPADFPAEVLQQFRTVSLLLNAILWGGTGLIFGWLVGRGTPSSMLSKATRTA